MDVKKMNNEREKEIARDYRRSAEALADDAQRKAAVDKVCVQSYWQICDNSRSIVIGYQILFYCRLIIFILL